MYFVIKRNEIWDVVYLSVMYFKYYMSQTWSVIYIDIRIKRISLFEHIIFNLENHSAKKVYIICESYCEKGFGVFLERLEGPCTALGEFRGTLHGYGRV